MKVNLSNVLKELEEQIDSSKNLVVRIKGLSLPRIQIEIITELAFLRVFMAWENFLEESFVRYLIGGKSPSGNKIKRFVNPPNMEKATKMILGERRDFVSWSSASDVIARSIIYFHEGKPFKDALDAITRDIDNMNTIRNRIAHRSKMSKNKFNDFIRSIFGHGISGMTPGRFLLKNTISDPQITYFDYYVEMIKTASGIII